MFLYNKQQEQFLFTPTFPVIVDNQKWKSFLCNIDDIETTIYILLIADTTLPAIVCFYNEKDNSWYLLQSGNAQNFYLEILNDNINFYTQSQGFELNIIEENKPSINLEKTNLKEMFQKLSY